MNVFVVKFNISRTAEGHYRASCAELTAFAEAPTLPELEAKLSMLARALLSEATEERAQPAEILVTRIFPAPSTKTKVS